MYKGSLFSTSSSTSVICVLFDDSHSDRCEVISHCGFFYINLFIYFWLGWVFVAVHRLLIAVASLVAEHGL